MNYRVHPGVVLQIRRLRGQFVPTARDRPVTFDDRSSFVVRVDSAEVAISTSNLTTLLNTYVLAYEDAPLKNVSVSAAGHRLKQTGTMHKGVDLPFEVEGELSTTVDGAIRLHSDNIKSAHIPFKGLLHLFGENLSKLVNLNEARGLMIEGDDILLYPNRMTPPPHIEGRVSSVRIDGTNIVQIFSSGSPAVDLQPPAQARNFIYHRGGVLRFGKLTMHDSDLMIIDDTPATPFDFNLADYNRQLVAGYSKNTVAHGLIVHMPDYVDLLRGANARRNVRR